MYETHWKSGMFKLTNLSSVDFQHVISLIRIFRFLRTFQCTTRISKIPKHLFFVYRGYIGGNRTNKHPPLPPCNDTHFLGHPLAVPPACNAIRLQCHPLAMPPACNATRLQCHPLAMPPACNATRLQGHPLARPPAGKATRWH